MMNKITITEIATAAHNLPAKPKKAALYDTVIDIIERNGYADTIQLAELYSFFIPHFKAIKIKTPYHWVTLARGDQDIRAYLNSVYGDGDRTIATNGHRLHLLNGTGLKKGHYDDAGMSVEVEGNYPNVNSVIPAANAKYEVLQFDQLEVNAHKKQDSYIMPDGYGMNTSYAKEAIALSDNFELYYYKTSRILKVIHKEEDAIALVMAMRI